MPAKRGRHASKSGSKSRGRATPKGTRPSGHVHPHIRAIFVDAAEVVHDEPADAECFASSFQQVFRVERGPRPDDVLREALRVGGLVGLFISRSVKVFGPAGAHHRADVVYEKLAAKSAPPQWLIDMGNVTVRDVVMVREPYGDGYGIYLEYDDPLSRDIRTIGVYIDVNMGCMATDVIDGPPISAIREAVATEAHIEVVPIDPAEARARVEAAFAELDDDPEPDLSDDFDDLRALAEQRFSLLPAGGSVTDDRVELSEDELEELVDSFVRSPHFFGLPSAAREVGYAICLFADYHDGDPLRWSPVLVELFLVDWIPTEITGSDELYAAVPNALRAWIRFAGAQKGLAAELIDETVQSVDQWLDEYYELVQSPEVGAVVAELAAAMTRQGIDVDDERAVLAFIDEYQAGLSGVDVDLDRAEEGLRAQWVAFQAQLVDLLKASLESRRGAAAPEPLADRDAAIDSLASTLDPALEEWSRLGQTDLLRVVSTLCLEGAGTEADADRLTRMVEPEEGTAALVAREAFDHAVATWRELDVVDDAARLTPLGQWLLPRALARAWGGDFDR